MLVFMKYMNRAGNIFECVQEYVYSLENELRGYKTYDNWVQNNPKKIDYSMEAAYAYTFTQVKFR